MLVFKKNDEPSFETSADKKDLIDQGVELERFMRDDDIVIRYYLMEKHPEFIPQMITLSEDDYLMACDIVSKEKNISIDILDTLINHCKREYAEIDGKHKERINNYIIKKRAIEYEATLIESTMSLRNLFETKSPLWARLYTPSQIEKIIEIYTKINKNEEEEAFLDQFETIFAPENSPAKMQNTWKDYEWAQFMNRWEKFQEELYLAKNLLWARGLSLNDIENVVFLEEYSPTVATITELLKSYEVTT